MVEYRLERGKRRYILWLNTGSRGVEDGISTDEYRLYRCRRRNLL
jgi:hypothetical protein